MRSKSFEVIDSSFCLQPDGTLKCSSENRVQQRCEVMEKQTMSLTFSWQMIFSIYIQTGSTLWADKNERSPQRNPCQCDVVELIYSDWQTHRYNSGHSITQALLHRAHAALRALQPSGCAGNTAMWCRHFSELQSGWEGAVMKWITDGAKLTHT